jgi:hypothetical protein
MKDTDARLWHPWLRINRVLRVMLHQRDRHRVGAHAVARDAAGGVGAVEEVLVARRAGGSYASFF